MMRITNTIAGVGLMLAALGAYHVFAGDSAPDPERKRICAPGFPQSQRPSEVEWRAISWSVLKRAGIPWEEKYKFEIDHIIAIGIGGRSTLDNLQAQPCYKWTVDQYGHHCTAGPAAVKDVLERKAREDYCSGRATKAEVWARFKREWP